MTTEVYTVSRTTGTALHLTLKHAHIHFLPSDFIFVKEQQQRKDTARQDKEEEEEAHLISSP